VTAGFINGRYDLVISGLALADDIVESVSLLRGGQIAAHAHFGGTSGTQQIFQLSLSQKIGSDAHRTSFEIVVRTRGDHEKRTAFVIAADPSDPQTARIVEGPVCELPLLAKAFTPVLLYVEQAALDRKGVLYVRGWSVAHAQIVAIQVFVGDRRMGNAQLGDLRDDITTKFPDYPNARNSGFRYSGAVEEGVLPSSIAVEAIDRNGSIIRVLIPTELGTKSRDEANAGPLPASKPQVQSAPDLRRALTLHCDEVFLSTNGELLVSGWAVCATGVSEVAVCLNDELVGFAELGLPRPDVGDKYLEIPQARYSGFRLTRQLADPPQPGAHEVGLLARNGLDDMRALAVAVTVTSPDAAIILPASATPLSQPEFRFQLDNPVVIGGALPDPVVGRLVIEGWALARSGVASIDVLLDGRQLGQAYYGTARRDVEAAFPEWENALRCGYIFHCPPRALESGAHVICLQLTAKNGRSLTYEFSINAQQSVEAEDYATIRRNLSRAAIDLYSDVINRLDCRPTFQIVLVARAPVVQDELEVTLSALRAQAYSDWRLLVITDATDLTPSLESIGILELGDRVAIVHSESKQAALLSEVAAAGTCFIGALYPGDELGCDALAEFAIAHGLHAEAEFFYADEDRISPASGTREPFFKPAWSPDLLLSTNYIGRPWFATADLLARAGVTPETLWASQGDYDATLRCTELTSRIHHLPKLLSRRGHSDALGKTGERHVLEAAVARRGIRAELFPGCIAGSWRLRRTVPPTGKVSIIVPTCAAQGHIATCIETLRAKTAYRNFEIICIDNIPPDLPEWKTLIRSGADKVVEISEAFNWSRFNNRAAEQASGEYLLFLNDDVEIEREDWLDALLEHAQRPEVGIVGAQLLYPDRKVQHAGIFLTTLGAGRHSFRFLDADAPGYFGLALTQRNVIAITGACMLMRRDVFVRLGGFDEAHEVVNNDVDCCLRAWQAGLSVVYTPYAQLIHHELASRANIKDIFNAEHFARRWRTRYATGDPFFSPRLTKFADEYRPDTEPARMICAGRPLFSQDEIQRILVVKLDHIGDLITALPALRRLRRHFPTARIHLLASAAAKSFLEGEDCVDEHIEFAFFHARSDRGEKGLTENDLTALTRRLAPYRFDLAIDMRKQIETRHVLQSIPARFRAGYDHLGRFPWLDVALEWEGDNQLRRKHSHVSDDLLRLVDAVATAGETDRAVLPQAVAGEATLPESISAEVSALFTRPVVAVHPGVGAVMRQWPAEHFASVIDLLIEQDATNVLLIGGRDEAELAEDVLSQVVHRENVVSLAGRTSLAELRGLLRACALYLGNNSGPKHIAAALGVPTIGIHSGVVDATEWAPVGPRAIAVQKNMICSPCYLVKSEDCVRDLACLKRLEPGVVHRYCQMMLARNVKEAKVVETPKEVPRVGRVRRRATGQQRTLSKASV
jgi:ADP-heptose:LPS heptosyltransferase/GT2 family glycosyltransferase